MTGLALPDPDSESRVRFLMRFHDMVRRGETSKIDALLASAPVETLDETRLVLLLRGTYAFKRRLRDWRGFRDRVAAELKQRGAPVDKLLMGLWEEWNDGAPQC